MIIKNLSMLSTLAGALALMAACSSPPESDDAEVGEAKDVEVVENAIVYKADLNASQVEWIGTKSTGWHNGTIDIRSGEVEVKDGEIVGGNFVMDMTTLVAKDEKMNQEMNTKLTGHLKSPDFFEAGTYPTAEFVLTGLEPTDATITEETTEETKKIEKYKVTNPTHMVSGNLTVKGITKGITFPAKVTLTEDRVEAVAKFNLNRKDFELNWQYPEGEAVLHDVMHLGIKLVAKNKAQAAL